MRTTLQLFLLVMLGQISYGQSFYFHKGEPPRLKVNSDTSELGFFGGLKNARAANIDLNFDGVQDLVMFNYSDDKVLTFLGNGDKNNPAFSYAPDYEDRFPDLNHWIFIVDYNCDNKPDIFTASGIGGVYVYKNISSGDKLKFQQVETGKDTFELYYFDPDINFYVPVYSNSTDVSVVYDVDNDGDVDFLSFDSGGGDVQFYSNQSQERYGDCEHLEFLVETYCWGMFEESNTNSTLKHKTVCALDQFKKGIHSGSNMLVFDRDDDGDLDLALSDISGRGVQLLTNGRVDNSWRKDTMLTIEDAFPRESKAIDIDLFPAMFYLDLDFDGVRDLYVAPGPSSDAGYSPNQSWYYKNIGKNSKPVFDFKQDDFLVGQSIDLGENVYPVLFDEDGDGDLDLIIAGPKPVADHSLGYYRLALYTNVGSKSQPVFALTDDDFLSLFDREELHASPAFGDVDGNGTIDLVISVRDDKKGTLLYYKNAADPKSKAAFSLESEKLDGIETTPISSPFLYDLDQDNSIDLILGTDSGFIDFWKGNGTGSFQLQTNHLGNVQVSLSSGQFYIGGEATPVIADIDNDQKPELLVGNDYGEVFFYDDIDVSQSDFNQRRGFYFNETFNDTLEKRFGTYSALAIGDVNGDTLADLFIGTKRGGVHYLQGGIFTNISVPEILGQRSLELYPNPSQGLLNVEITGHDFRKSTCVVINAFGKEVYSSTSHPQKFVLNTESWPSGLYQVCLINEKGLRASRPLIVE